MVCLGPNCDKSASILKSACELAARSRGATEVRAIHVPKTRDWRIDPSVAALLRTASSVSAPSVSVDIDVVDGGSSVKRAIVNELEVKHPDLCVIGADSRTGPLGIFNTVQFVLKRAPCDILVVRDDGLSNLTSGEPIKALVCFGINDWEGSIDAFKATLRIARPGDVIEAVHVVHAGGQVDAVFGPPMVVPPGNGTTEEKISRSLEKAMLEALDDESSSLSRYDVEIRPKVLFAGMDNPVKVLIDYAEINQASILSVGVGSIGRILSPVNFSYQLTRKSPCSVLVARKTDDEAQKNIECSQPRSSGASFYVEDPQEWVKTKSFI